MAESDRRQERESAFDRVAVIGLGYVGLPLCLAMHRAGGRVLGVDVDPAKVESLRSGRSYLKHLGTDEIAAMARSDRFEATADASRLVEVDAMVICVPTPLDDSGRPDLRYVEQTARSVGQALATRGQSERGPALVVLESTTYPGTTRELVKPILDEAGVEYRLAFSPERVDPGRADPPIEAIPKLVGGIDEASTRAAAALYGRAFERVVPVRSAEVAEAAKLMENVYRAVNIALVNEMKVVLDAMGIDVWEVIEAAATKPFGYHAFWPGPGLGGHCIPIDPFYLSWKARQVGVEAEFIELAGRVNRAMPGRVVEVTRRELERRGIAAPWRVLILGLAYKPEIDDVRESPSFELIRLFREAGCCVEYSDPHVPATHPMRHYGDLSMRSVEPTPERLAQYDAVIVATAHRAFDWPTIARHSRLIVDTRNVLRDWGGGNVVKA